MQLAAYMFGATIVQSIQYIYSFSPSSLLCIHIHSAIYPYMHNALNFVQLCTQVFPKLINPFDSFT